MVDKFSATTLIFASSLLFGGMALGHHSFADFDRGKTGTISGTVRTLEWENPHIWLWVNAVDASGNTIAWGFEGSAPAEMARQGFGRRELIPGDKVTVTFHPLRDGRNGGSFSRIVKADGSVLVGGGAPGANGAK